MKSPLQYQASECDCCPATFVNALKYLFDRKLILPDVIKETYDYTLNRIEARGTTREATEELVTWLNKYSEEKTLNLECVRYTGNIVETEFIKKELIENTVIILRLWSITEHYVLVTGIDDDYLYIFDPYYDTKETYINDKDVEVVLNNNDYNRIVKISRLDLIDNKKDYTLGSIRKRECVIMRRKENE